MEIDFPRHWNGLNNPKENLKKKKKKKKMHYVKYGETFHSLHMVLNTSCSETIIKTFHYRRLSLQMKIRR